MNMLIQIDKLVQLLESPVFTCEMLTELHSQTAKYITDLRLQLLEPEKYPHLYKCLYGLLMLLPQSSAFAALKNRLNSVSAIGYLHIAPRAYVLPPLRLLRCNIASILSLLILCRPPPTPTTAFDRPNRLKAREEGGIKWVELLEKFKSVQEKARRAQRAHNQVDNGSAAPMNKLDPGKETPLSEVAKQPPRPLSAESAMRPTPLGHKPKSSLGNFSRLTGGVGVKKVKK